jgi:ketosteroid isomerase-like protein
MDPHLQEVLDHHEIRKLLAEYCHACDRADAELMASVYTGDDSFDDHGLVRAPGPEYARKMTDLILQRSEVVSHILGQSLIKVDGDVAGAETFFLGLMRIPGADGTPRLNQLAGRFIDQFERIDGKWRIKHRVAVRDTSITFKVEEDMQATYGMTPGRRDRDDPGAALIGIAHQA